MYTAYSPVPWLPPPLALPVLSCCLGFPSFVAWGVGLHCSNLFCSNFQVYLVFTYSILAWAAQLLFCFEVVINIPPVMFLDGLVKLRKALIEFLL